MPRKILRDKDSFETEPDSDRKEYNPPEEKLVDTGLVARLMEHYTSARDNGLLELWNKHDFWSEVGTLSLVIKDIGAQIPPQLLIDSLAAKLKGESDRQKYTRTLYLGAVVQALYNLDHGNEFVIDITHWPEDKYRAGWFLRGRPDQPLVLNLYGDFNSCGDSAEHCNFTLYDSVKWCGTSAKYCDFTAHGEVEYCGPMAEHSDFTLYDKVEFCGTGARYCRFTFNDKVWVCGTASVHCRFDLMPCAEIEIDRITYSSGNVLRKQDENGQWKKISKKKLKTHSPRQ